MNNLASAIADEIVEIAARQLGNLESAAAELRIVFNGPPQVYLTQVFEQLVQDGGIRSVLGNGQEVLVPVLLMHENGASDTPNPPVGVSGLCDQNHILDLRNSTQCPRFLVLSGPGSHSNLSQNTTWSYCGLAPQNQLGSSSISDWLRDEFIDTLIAKGLLRCDSVDSEWIDHGRSLVADSISAADSADRPDGRRLAAWNVLSRLWSIERNASNPAMALSLVCGFPPPRDRKLPAADQIRAMHQLADLLEDGFKLTVDQLKDRADDDDQKLALDQFLAQLQLRCPTPTAITQGLPWYYAPFTGEAISAPPSWWSTLTLERWQSLLEETTTRPEALEIRCLNSIAPLQSGVVPVVSGEVRLELKLPDSVGALPQTLQITRETGSAGSRKTWDVVVTVRDVWVDSDPPPHKRPIKYTVSAANLASASLHAISMNAWVPGILVCGRDSRKVTPPRTPRTRTGGVALETFLTLRSEGRQYLNVFVGPNFSIEGSAKGTDPNATVGSGEDEAAIARISEREYGLEVYASSDKAYDLAFTSDTAGPQTLRINLTCDDIQAEQCASEFERLVLLNRAKRDRLISSSVYVNTTVRSSDLQGWMLEKNSSYYPLVFGPDYAENWRARNWESQEDTIISRGRFLSDPRPSLAEMCPPRAFLEARQTIASMILDHEQGLVEGVPFAIWLSTKPDFPELLGRYLRSYIDWLDQAPEVASWCDLSIVTGFEGDQQTLVLEPDAILISPLHPIRLAWHAAAQRALLQSYRKKPCPAASILDPRCVPDSLTLAIQTASGEIRERVFLSVECNSDYWSVLWNSNRADRIGETLPRTPFDSEFGIEVGGMANSFSTSQVGRSLDDISKLLSAKPWLNISITSASTKNTSTNEGLVEWCRSQFSKETEVSPLDGRIGRRCIRVLDQRGEDHRPQEAEISNLAEDTENSVTWYATKQITEHPPDLTIVAQLETSSMSAEKSTLASPISPGGLFRVRVRRQLPAGRGAFLSESRVALPPVVSGDALLDHTANALAKLENRGSTRHAYVFAPSVHNLQQSLSSSRYVAVSSSAIDPACFLGGWLSEMYLWDYDLPSYSSRAGDCNGYYLLAKISDLDRDTLREVVRRLPNCDDLTQDAIDNLILEVAKRGIPTVRGLSTGDSGALGDLGLFVAARLLQDEFRVTGSKGSLFPIWRDSEGETTINLLVPVDPFQNYLDDLAKAIGKTRQRPDLLLITFHIERGNVKGRIVPIEVKYRNSTDSMPEPECVSALAQTHAFAELLKQISDLASEEEMLMWKMARKHLQLAFIDYGFRVYSQQASIAHRGSEWVERQTEVMKAVIEDEMTLECDARGRLIVIDGSASSAHRDIDGDGFFETICLSRGDAAEIVSGNPDSIYGAIGHKLGRWGTELQRSERRDISGEAEISGARKDGPIIVTSASGPQVGVSTVNGIPSIDLDGDAKALPDSMLVQSSSLVNNAAGVTLQIGTPLDDFRPEVRSLSLSDTNLNQLNIGVVGDLGTGKTQLLKSLVFQITRQREENKGIQPNILILDYKRDYSSADFVESTNAKVIRPKNLNINLFDISQAADSTTPWLDRFSFFADVLDKIYSGIGPVQRQTLRNAVKSSYNSRSGTDVAPTIYDIFAAYQQITGGRPDSVSSIIEEMVDRELFAANANSTSTKDFFSGVVVISLDALGQDDRAKNMLVAIILNMFYENMLKIPKRAFYGTNSQKRIIDSFLLVDEADNIMKYEFDVLRKVLLQGREFGVGVILASQYLRHFKAGATDYREPLLTWLIHKVPNVVALELGALGMTSNQIQTAERIKTLGLHECLYKTSGVGGEFLKGLPFYQLLKE